jgi:hypothetical protein
MIADRIKLAPRKPLVGYPGINNSLVIQRRGDGIECRIATVSYLFVLAGTGVFGPLLGLLLYLCRDQLDQHTPRFITWAVWLLVVLAAAGFVRYALGRPKFEVDYGSGEIRYYAWRSPSPSLVLRRKEIRDMEIREWSFVDEGSSVANYYLTVTTGEDKRYALCVSTDKKIVEALKTDLENAGIGRM